MCKLGSSNDFFDVWSFEVNLRLASLRKVLLITSSRNMQPLLPENFLIFYLLINLLAFRWTKLIEFIVWKIVFFLVPATVWVALWSLPIARFYKPFLFICVKNQFLLIVWCRIKLLLQKTIGIGILTFRLKRKRITFYDLTSVLRKIRIIFHLNISLYFQILLLFMMIVY